MQQQQRRPQPPLGHRSPTTLQSDGSTTSRRSPAWPGSTAGLARGEECVQDGGSWDCWPSSALDSNSPAGAAVDRELEVFRICAEHFRHDLTAFWNHSTYFLLIQGALFAVFITLIGPQDGGRAEGVVPTRDAAAYLAIVGCIFATAWAWVARRRLVFIGYWRANVTHLAGRVDRHGVYLRVESLAQSSWLTPDGFTAKLPVLVSLLWLAGLVLVAAPASG